MYPFSDRPSITFSSNEGPSPGVCAEGEQASLHTHSDFFFFQEIKVASGSIGGHFSDRIRFHLG